MIFSSGMVAEGGFGLTLVATAFAFGLRHGIDWDHIAAISDITSSQETARKSIRFATLYALGHGVVVLALGLAAIEMGSVLPTGADAVMERFVGVTLLLLGIYVFYGLIRYGRDFRMRSRWMLVFSVIRNGLRGLRRRRARDISPMVISHDHLHHHDDSLHATHSHPASPDAERAGGLKEGLLLRHRHHHSHAAAMPEDPFVEYGTATALMVGAVHGVGAETPTQVLLFLSAVGAGGRTAGISLLVAFLAGLFASNTLIAVASTFGFMNARRNFALYATVAVLAGTFSLILGTLFVLGNGAILPALLGG